MRPVDSISARQFANTDGDRLYPCLPAETYSKIQVTPEQLSYYKYCDSMTRGDHLRSREELVLEILDNRFSRRRISRYTYQSWRRTCLLMQTHSPIDRMVVKRRTPLYSTHWSCEALRRYGAVPRNCITAPYLPKSQGVCTTRAHVNNTLSMIQTH